MGRRISDRWGCAAYAAYAAQPLLQLLRTLGESGTNRFRTWRAGDRDPAIRFPVFLRHELGTVYQAPQLLGNREAYEAECARIDKRGMLAIEFQDTADTHGVYRKYGCFIVGDRLIPRHLYMSRNWLVKSADIVDAAFLKEELDYMDANPHAQMLLKVCRMANIGYGRIDYALLNGEPQIWEINTTPQLLSPPGHDLPERAPVHAHFARGLAAAFDAIDPPGV